MSTRRLVTFLLGLWLGGSLFMYFVATHNLQTANEVLAAPQGAVVRIVEAIGHDSAWLLLRHQASEMNRHYFENWGLMQLAIAAAVFFVLLFASREGKWLVLLPLVMLLLVALMRYILTPDVVNYGRQLDFAAKSAQAAEYARFTAVHRAYAAAELVKCGLGVILLGMLLRRGERKRRSFRKVHAVDDPDHGHVDR